MSSTIRAALALVFFVAIFAITCSQASGGEYSYRDGYWWKGGVAYTRTAYQAYDYSCGWYWAYQYHKVASPVSYKQADWRERLLDLAKQRDAYVLGARNRQQEQALFEASVKALGLEGNFSVEGYGAGVNGGYGGGQVGPLDASGYYQQAPQGSSLYGYSILGSIGAALASSSPSEYVNHAARLRADSRRYEAEGESEFLAAVQAISEATLGAQSTVAEIQAKADAGVRLLGALRPEPRRVQVQGGAAGAYEPGVGLDLGSGGQAQEAFPALRRACASCHGGDKPKAGLRFDGSQYITSRLAHIAVEQVLTGAMPKNEGGAGIVLDDAARGEVLGELHALVNDEEPGAQRPPLRADESPPAPVAP